ncbi:DASH family cryptochrome [Kordia sp. YSTF-M3]|uniref:Cryptochrome DASH n=1 Tax=Kordia aestuariivivens TaxID=2759037 RepID=A0ABR7Q4C9_9FLAO|nr:DASH family cryptochrome [Kordia aestuariivivens]MBC8753416.1 DASH family cryptochrome [Kordia aestuariivivens]
MTKTGLVWFRNDLRVHDQISLLKASKENSFVIAAYCFDPRHFEKDRFGFVKTEKYRGQFLLETVDALQYELNQLNIPLFVHVGKPETILPEYIKVHNITSVYLQKEWTSEEVKVLENVKANVEIEVNFVESYDQFLYHPEDIPYEIEKIPKVFTGFRKKCEKHGNIRPLETISKMPGKNRVDHLTKVPTLKDLGLAEFEQDVRTAFPFKGGEKAGLARLHNYTWETKKLSYYKKTRNGLVGTDYSSKFSAWLANGSLSPRMIYHEVKKYESEIVKNESTYWMIFELIWRDFFKYISLKHENKIFKLEGILGATYEWKNDSKLIQQWIDGETSEPFVNANMLELKHTGWMSNRGRQNVASYFARTLQLDWRIGAAYFESVLLDYDVHSNYGNWMYVAGVGNDPRNRTFNVKLQAERYDANKKFQNRWLQTSLF